MIPRLPIRCNGVSKLFGRIWAGITHGFMVSSLFVGVLEQHLEYIGRTDDERRQTHTDHLRALYLSKRDLIDIFDKALQIDADYLVRTR